MCTSRNYAFSVFLRCENHSPSLTQVTACGSMSVSLPTDWINRRPTTQTKYSLLTCQTLRVVDNPPPPCADISLTCHGGCLTRLGDYWGTMFHYISHSVPQRPWSVPSAGRRQKRTIVVLGDLESHGFTASLILTIRIGEPGHWLLITHSVLLEALPAPKLTTLLDQTTSTDIIASSDFC